MAKRMAQRILFACLAALVALLLAASCAEGAPAPQLSAQYYAKKCPQAEAIVFQSLVNATRTNPRIAPQMLRMLFHDCFVRGCDASILLDGVDENPPEKFANPNLSIGGYEFVDAVKAKLERVCPGVVSCSDLLAMAGRDAVRVAGGPKAALRFGRLDGFTSSSADVFGKIPDGTGNVTTTFAFFRAQGLNLLDMITLSGAHTIGKSQCTFVENRIKFPDPTLAPAYQVRLSRFCGRGVQFNPNKLINNDPLTPTRFDNQYYKNLGSKVGLFTSDQSLLMDPRTRAVVALYARNQQAFFQQFSVSLMKLSEIGILSGANGQVRTNCRVLGSNSQ